MKAVMYRGIGQIAVEEIAKPEMKADDYLVEVLYSGLCGTDIKTYKQGHRMFTPPCVLGHEFSGRIVAAGPEVDASLVGKKVVVAPYSGCGQCAMCRNGFEDSVRVQGRRLDYPRLATGTPFNQRKTV